MNAQHGFFSLCCLFDPERMASFSLRYRFSENNEALQWILHVVQGQFIGGIISGLHLVGIVNRIIRSSTAAPHKSTSGWVSCLLETIKSEWTICSILAQLPLIVLITWIIKNKWYIHIYKRPISLDSSAVLESISWPLRTRIFICQRISEIMHNLYLAMVPPAGHREAKPEKSHHLYVGPVPRNNCTEEMRSDLICYFFLTWPLWPWKVGQIYKLHNMWWSLTTRFTYTPNLVNIRKKISEKIAFLYLAMVPPGGQ